MKRSDAKYCDARCRQRAYDALRAKPELLRNDEILNPPDDFEDSDLEYYRWWWSSPVPCQACLRFTKVQIVMRRVGSPTRLFVCDWNCFERLFDLDL